jgi:hypothetical protein
MQGTTKAFARSCVNVPGYNLDLGAIAGVQRFGDDGCFQNIFQQGCHRFYAPRCAIEWPLRLIHIRALRNAGNIFRAFIEAGS